MDVDPTYRADRSIPRIGMDVARGLRLELPDLSLPDTDNLRLRRALVAGCIQLLLPDDGPALHAGLIADVQAHLAGRGESVWQEDDLLNIAFGVFSHEDKVQVEEFADRVARRLGATVALATTIGVLASTEAKFLQI